MKYYSASQLPRVHHSLICAFCTPRGQATADSLSTSQTKHPPTSPQRLEGRSLGSCKVLPTEVQVDEALSELLELRRTFD